MDSKAYFEKVMQDFNQTSSGIASVFASIVQMKESITIG